MKCPVFEAARRKFQWGDILPDLPTCLSCHGWPVIPLAWFDLARYFAQLPLVCLLDTCNVCSMQPLICGSVSYFTRKNMGPGNFKATKQFIPMDMEHVEFTKAILNEARRFISIHPILRRRSAKIQEGPLRGTSSG